MAADTSIALTPWVSPTPAVAADRATNETLIFSVGFALAAVFHVLGNPRLAPSWSLTVLGIAAGWVLLAPRSSPARSALAASVLATAWLEAPVLGNHWLLASLISLAWLISAGTGAVRRLDDAVVWERFARTARVTLLVAYSFAAFAKLNADFFDPIVSCAGFYLRESAGSIGLDALAESPTGWIDQVAMYGTAGIELIIPVLLVVRRTRPFGVVLALGFHFVLAIDRTHQFFDFSSLLTVLFLLFASTQVQQSVLDTASGLRRRLANVWAPLPQLLHRTLVILIAGGLALTLGPRRWPLSESYRDVGLVAFWIGGAAVVVVVARATWRTRTAQGEPASIRPVAGLLLLVPILAFANGLTPYTEVKTGYGWNMYSNLRTVDGESNHFIIRSTVPLRDQQQSLVRIVDSSDPRLGFYGQFDYLLTYERFRDHLARYPDTSVTYERDGELIEVERAGDVPGLARALPEIERRLLLFRAVDDRDRERCLQGFGPVR